MKTLIAPLERRNSMVSELTKQIANLSNVKGDKSAQNAAQLISRVFTMAMFAL